MSTAAFFQPAAMGFVTGLALIWASALAFRLPQAPVAHWLLLAASAALQGAAALFRIMQSEDAGAAAQLFTSSLAAASYFALFEVARRHFHGDGKLILKPWLHALPAGVAFLATIFYGPASLAAICRFVLAIPAGLAAAIALTQSSRAHRYPSWQVPLAGAAVVFLGVGEAFAAHPLQAFAAAGFLAAIWSESRRQRPLDREASATQKWRWPAAFLAIAIAGSTVMAIREQASQPTVEVGLSAVESGEAAAVAPLEPMNIDPRQIARDRAAAQRAKQGMIFLAVVAGVAVAWIALSQLPSVRR